MDPDTTDIPMVELKTKTRTQTVTLETQIEVHSEEVTNVSPPNKSTDEIVKAPYQKR